tara:strand:+ start:102 stop:428 length:327 start_codon:yes stop_codon:yes gene_type:complete
MATYKNITSASTSTLISKVTDIGTIARGRQAKNPGAISQISISNKHASHTTTVDLFLHDGTNSYTVVKTNIPPLSKLLLDDKVDFDGTVYDLKITTSSAGYDLAIIIK